MIFLISVYYLTYTTSEKVSSSHVRKPKTGVPTGTVNQSFGHARYLGWRLSPEPGTTISAVPTFLFYCRLTHLPVKYFTSYMAIGSLETGRV